jgi:hypothetical protein
MLTEKVAEEGMRQGSGRECREIGKMDTLKKAEDLDLGNPADVDCEADDVLGGQSNEK